MVPVFGFANRSNSFDTSSRARCRFRLWFNLGSLLYPWLFLSHRETVASDPRQTRRSDTVALLDRLS